jgi:hypothetical protein
MLKYNENDNTLFLNFYSDELLKKKILYDSNEKYKFIDSLFV